jgi:hypothetical protein
MAIKILYRDHHHCPIVVCDVCSDMIADFTEGAAVFLGSAPENSKLCCIHVHKGKCHDKAEEGMEDSGWEELGAHIAYILHNLRITPDTYKELQAMLAMRRECGL